MAAVRRAGIGALLIALVVSLTAVVGAATPSWQVERVAGADRYATAVAASQRAFPRGATDVVVASGESFADALAATPAAARLGGPLLLTRRDSLPQSVVDELRRLSPQRILLAGGTSAVSSGVEFALGTIAPVRRAAGPDRFATSAAVASDAFATGVPVTFLANGRNFPDALAAGNVAARLGGPVLLVERDRVPDAVVDGIDGLRPSRLVLVGGPAAVGDEVRRQLTDHSQIDRIAGADRYETAAALVAAAPGTAPIGVLASGADFADALAGGPVAAALGGSLVLAAPTCLPTSEAQELADAGVERLIVIGGTRAVSDAATQPCGEVTTTTTTAPPTSSSGSEGDDGGSSGGGGGGGDGDSTDPATTTTTSSTTTTPTSTTTTSSTTTTTVPTGPTTPTFAVRSLVDFDSPDPTVLRVGDTYYAYTTQKDFFVPVPMYSSSDLVTWTAQGNVLELPSWAILGFNWAPSVVQTAPDRFVLWYTVRLLDPTPKSDGDVIQCISRAVASSPQGRFVDDSTAPPICQDSLGGSIDPHVFTDTTGERFLYWKSDENAVGKPSRLWVAPLDADATAITSPAAEVLAQTQAWESPTIEQPAVVRDGATYYLFYSGGWWDAATYAVGYATGPTPLGPFTKRSTSQGIVRTAAGFQGPGALDLFVGPDQGLWGVVHAWGDVIGYSKGGKRTMRFGRLTLP
jgi:putative cell wall-binding protein